MEEVIQVGGQYRVVRHLRRNLRPYITDIELTHWSIEQ